MIWNRVNGIVALTFLAGLLQAGLAVAQERGQRQGPAVYRARVEPHWLDDGRFWYRNDLADEARQFILVNPAAVTREPAFDHQRLAAALSAAAGADYTADHLPFEMIEFADGGATTLRFTTGERTWDCNLQTYELSESDGPAVIAPQREPPTTRRRRPAGREGPQGQPRPEEAKSPDGQHSAVIREHNIVLLSADGSEMQLTTDGSADFAYTRLFWSPDSKRLVAYRLEPGDHLPVYRLESSPRRETDSDAGPGRALLHTAEYPLPGDKLDSYELTLFDVETGGQVRPEVDRIDVSAGGSHPRPAIHWREDGRRFLYEKHERGHQRLRVIEVDSQTGEARSVIDEKAETFIWTAHTETLRLDLINYLGNGREIIYVSERSGWRHLYLVDIDSGDLKPITKGPWVIRGINQIDEQSRQIWFSACGIFPGQDPYLLHYGRVNFDGSGLTWLTEGDGNHSISFEGQTPSFSPDRQYLITTHSRVDSPPVSELRRVADGSLVMVLETAQVESSWQPPEVFVAKGRDGVTDIWGIICRPADFDPAKKYPVIEDIYAGPQSAFVPKSFSPRLRYENLTRLGFIVVKIDGMGTAHRSKAFHDVCWKNLADAGFPDRIAWMKAAAEKYPQMDLERVGVYGGSAGGQNAAGALLFHGDFYKAAVANCGCHDNRMDKISWNEQWMGWPVGPQYSASSNIDNAHRLRGRLQLVVGELDSNVPPESTFRFVDALVRAGKEFEFVLIPGANHGAGSRITQRKLQDFFVKDLLAEDPPNHNLEQGEDSGSSGS